MNYLSNYQTFQSKNELNEAIAVHVNRHNTELNETDRSVFMMLSQYAVKFPGAAHLKIGTIAKTIKKTDRTIRTALAKLINLKMIERIEFMRTKSGGNGANIFCILPPATSARQDEEKPEISTAIGLENENETIFLKLKPISNTKGTEKSNIPADDKSHLKAVLPDGWYEQATAYAKDAKDLYAITGELFKAKHGTTIKIEDYVEEFGQVLQQSWFNLKQGRVNPNRWYAYLYAAFKRTARNLESYQKAKPIMDGIKELFDPNYQPKIKSEYANKYPLQKNINRMLF